MRRILLGTLLLCLGVFMLMPVAEADTMDGVTFSLTSADLSGAPGDVLTWNYSLTDMNTDPGVVYILAQSVNSAGFDSTTGTPDSSVFEPVLLAGGSGGGMLFAFDSFPGVPSSFNSGTFTLTVALLDANLNPLGAIDLTENYTATIGTVPEPGALTFLALGLTCCLALSRKVF